MGERSSRGIPGLNDAGKPHTGFSIDGKRVVITGGTAGIGLAVAAHFVRAGAKVVVTGRRDTGSALADSIGASFVRMDVDSDASVFEGMSEAANILGGIDVLILNAGIYLESGNFDNFKLDAFHEVLDTNVGGVARGLAAGVKHLERGGVILVTSSPGGRVAIPGGGAYAVSKAAVDMLVKSAALELAPRGIRVTAVLPGVIDSELGGAHETDEYEWLISLTAAQNGRPASEMGLVYQFLASDAAQTFHGSCVAADDGVSAGISSKIFDAVLAM